MPWPTTINGTRRQPLLPWESSPRRVHDAEGSRLKVVYGDDSYHLPLNVDDPSKGYEFVSLWDAVKARNYRTSWLINYVQKERLTPQKEIEPIMRNVHPPVEHAAWVTNSMVLREEADREQAEAAAQDKVNRAAQLMVQEDAVRCRSRRKSSEICEA